MTPKEEIPKRSNLWLDHKSEVTLSGKLFDPITSVFFIFLVTFSFVVFWPISSAIEFKGAFTSPVVPFLINVLGTLTLSPQDAVRILFVFSFATATAGIYLFVRELVKRQVTPIFAALLYMIPPVPLFILNFISRGLTPAELESAESFLSILYGQVDAFLAISLIPFAAIFFLMYLKKDSIINLIVGVFICGIVFLTNESQSLSMILVLLVLTTTELFIGMARLKFKRFLQFLLISAGLVAFWYLPIVLEKPSVLFKSQLLVNLKYLFPFPFIIGFLSLLFSFVVFGRREDRQGIFASFLLFVVFFSLTADWLINGRTYAAHPNRLIADLTMFSAMVLSLSGAMIFDKLNLVKYLKFERWTTSAKILGTIIFGLVSFIVILIASILIAPIVIKIVSGPAGVWVKIRNELATDRLLNIGAAGGSLKLISTLPINWQLALGIALSLVVLTILIFVLLQNATRDEENNYGS